MTTATVSILVVEDEAPIRDGLHDILDLQGYRVASVDRGDVGLQQAIDGGFDLVLLDLMLPGLDGFEVCRRLRQARPQQAICLLTARGAEQDVLDGFAAGADDYVTKPFSVQQLLARVRSLLRRCGSLVERLDLGDIQVDCEALRASRGARQVDLSPRDVAVLACLLRHHPAVVERADLLREVWDYGRVGGVETRCVDMHLVKLRRKLDQGLGSGSSAIIATVRGVGYRLALDDS